MTDPREQDVAALKQRAEQLARDRDKAIAQRDSAQEDADRHMSKLRDEFKVSTLEEAEAMLAQIDAALDAEMAKIREGLN